MNRHDWDGEYGEMRERIIIIKSNETRYFLEESE